MRKKTVKDPFVSLGVELPPADLAAVELAEKGAFQLPPGHSPATPLYQTGYALADNAYAVYLWHLLRDASALYQAGLCTFVRVRVAKDDSLIVTDNGAWSNSAVRRFGARRVIDNALEARVVVWKHEGWIAQEFRAGLESSSCTLVSEAEIREEWSYKAPNWSVRFKPAHPRFKADGEEIAQYPTQIEDVIKAWVHLTPGLVVELRTLSFRDEDITATFSATGGADGLLALNRAKSDAAVLVPFIALSRGGSKGLDAPGDTPAISLALRLCLRPWSNAGTTLVAYANGRKLESEEAGVYETALKEGFLAGFHEEVLTRGQVGGSVKREQVKEFAETALCGVLHLDWNAPGESKPSFQDQVLEVVQTGIKDWLQQKRDVYLDIEFDASLVTWLCTANDPARIPDSLRSRMREFLILPPTGINAVTLAPTVVQAAIAQLGIVGFEQPSEEICLRMAHLTAREIYQETQNAVSRANANGRRRLVLTDLAAHILSAGTDDEHADADALLGDAQVRADAIVVSGKGMKYLQ